MEKLHFVKLYPMKDAVSCTLFLDMLLGLAWIMNKGHTLRLWIHYINITKYTFSAVIFALVFIYEWSGRLPGTFLHSPVLATSLLSSILLEAPKHSPGSLEQRGSVLSWSTWNFSSALCETKVDLFFWNQQSSGHWMNCIVIFCRLHIEVH